MTFNERAGREHRGNPFAPFEHDAGGDAGILLLHGFSGSAFEMRELGERLRARGRNVLAPALPGHHGDVAALERIGIDDYLASAESAFDEAQRRWQRVAVIGLSMGGSLGLYLAQRKPVAALITINAPVRMSAHVHHGVPVVTRFAATAPLPVNANALFGGAGYATVSARAVETFLGVVALARAGLKDITCPLLVLHSARDLTVPASNAAVIEAGVSSSDRRAIVLSEGQHLMTVGRSLDMIDPFIIAFFERLDRGAARDGRTSGGLS